MSTTVTYKGSTLTTVNNQTRVMKTAGKYMEDDVTLVDITSVPVLQSKTVTIAPTTSPRSQTVTPDAGNDGLSQVIINVDAVPTGTEGTPIATKGAVSNHSVTITPSVVNSQGYIAGGTRTGNPVTVSASELVSGNKAITDNGTNIDVTNYATVSVNVTLPAPTLQTITKTYTPTESQQTETITPGTSYDGIGEVDVTVNAIPSTYVGSGIDRRTSSSLYVMGDQVLVPSGFYAENTAAIVSGGTEGTPIATKGTVSNHSVTVTPSVTNTTGYINGGTKTGTPVTISASELVAGTTLVADDSGDWYVANAETLTIPSGTAGTPTATKSAVSNHAVTVTPSVTNSGGWVSSGTKTGTAVSVSASELVSGSETKTQNGTYDVTNLAQLVVNVPSGKNVQAYLGYDDVASSSYIDTDVSVTVAKTGTYQVSWVGWRTTTSGTSGSRLYVNGVATGNAVTTFTGTYGQSVVQTNVSLEEGDVVVVRARSRNTSYRMYVANLIIEEE